MWFQVSSFLVILACLYLTMAQGSYDDCCMRYSKGIKPNVKKMVVKYRIQEADGGCNIPATVFTFMRGRQLCGDPEDIWVKKLMQKVDRKKHQHHRRGTKQVRSNRLQL
ncbi:hypothetical protein NHX12_004092 [Muraenolepis orangiensis]|uniref:Chemokine interleukin-8-like domain-containing protein n=1 Tax=Muraenolepis orangiensis TaxID=630683 RepID=A0A9Q0DUK3_9TELE|nr:hypothetical protein NHX12_004092 [Muraenolepis orangiensis]